MDKHNNTYYLTSYTFSFEINESRLSDTRCCITRYMTLLITIISSSKNCCFGKVGLSTLRLIHMKKQSDFCFVKIHSMFMLFYYELRLLITPFCTFKRFVLQPAGINYIWTLTYHSGHAWLSEFCFQCNHYRSN
jgi:hypothetical protein